MRNTLQKDLQSNLAKLVHLNYGLFELVRPPVSSNTSSTDMKS